MSKITDLFKGYERAGMVRLGLGARVDGPGELSRLRAQDAFLSALQETAPDVMISLYEGPVVEAFLRWNDRFMERCRLQREQGLEPDGLTHEEMTGDPEMRPFLWLAGEWGDRWNLQAGWMHKAALAWLLDRQEFILGGEVLEEFDYNGLPSILLGETLDDLVRAPGPRLLFAGQDVTPHSPDYWPMDVFPDDPETGDGTAEFDWNPGVESRADNERRAVAAFKARYRAAQDAREKEAEERYPNRTRRKEYEHFVWLVQFQVLEWSYSKVAREANRRRSTVTEAIQDTAALIELPLRTA